MGGGVPRVLSGVNKLLTLMDWDAGSGEAHLGLGLGLGLGLALAFGFGLGLGLGLGSAHGFGFGFGFGLETPLAHGVQLSGCAVGQVVRWHEAPV